MPPANTTVSAVQAAIANHAACGTDGCGTGPDRAEPPR